MPDPIPEEELARIEGLCEGATAGKWWLHGRTIRADVSGKWNGRRTEWSQRLVRVDDLSDCEIVGAADAEANAAFIASARSDVPALLSEVRRLRGENKDALKECSKWAREAGEAIGKLETSQWPGIVDGWRERADAAEARSADLERQITSLQEDMAGKVVMSQAAFDELQSAHAERDGLRGALKRLASTEAMEMARVIDRERDAELLARISYAAHALRTSAFCPRSPELASPPSPLRERDMTLPEDLRKLAEQIHHAKTRETITQAADTIERMEKALEEIAKAGPAVDEDGTDDPNELRLAVFVASSIARSALKGKGE